MLLLASTVAVSKLATTPKRCLPQGVCLFGMGVLHCVLLATSHCLPPWGPLILFLYRVGYCAHAPFCKLDVPQCRFVALTLGIVQGNALFCASLTSAMQC
jgi:hypothetical protein